MIVVVAKYSVAAGKRAEYLQAVADAGIFAKSRAEQGCISYEFLCSWESPDEVVALERWADAAQLAAHGKQPHFAELMAIKKQFGSTPTVVQRYETVE